MECRLFLPIGCMLHISVSLMCKFSGEVEVKEAEVAAVERDGDAER